MYTKWLLYCLILASTISMVKEIKSEILLRPHVVSLSARSLSVQSTRGLQQPPAILAGKSFAVRIARQQHSSSDNNNVKGERGWRGLVQYFRGLKWSPIPIGVGFALLAALQWRHIRNRLRYGKDEEVAPAKDWEITCYRLIPLRAFSRAWGWAMACEVPVWARPKIYSMYANTFGCDLAEAEIEDLRAYPCLGEFFCRKLKQDARPIDTADCLVSPADGRILQLGAITTAKVEQVKGVTYSLEAFLGDQCWSTDRQLQRSNYPKRLLQHDSGTRLYQCVIYLAPGDYHRFHSPVEWNVKFRRHFQGELLSVNPVVARWIPDLFSLNERAVYVGNWKHGFFSLTAVGATNVGSIKVYCDEDLVTNQRKWRHIRHKDTWIGPMQEGVSISKGELFGEFKMGSTIVIIFEAPEDFDFRPQLAQKIYVGEALSKCQQEIKS